MVVHLDVTPVEDRVSFELSQLLGQDIDWQEWSVSVFRGFLFAGSGRLASEMLTPVISGRRLDFGVVVLYKSDFDAGVLCLGSRGTFGRKWSWFVLQADFGCGRYVAIPVNEYHEMICGRVNAESIWELEKR